MTYHSSRPPARRLQARNRENTAIIDQRTSVLSGPMRYITRPSPGAMFIVYRLRPALLVANDSLDKTLCVVNLFLYFFKLFVVMMK